MNLWVGVMLKHKSQFKQAFDLDFTHFIDAGFVDVIWRVHLDGIIYPSQ